MIGYITIGTQDMTRAKAFYTELLGLLGAKLVIEMGRLALFGTGRGQPMFGVCLPYDGQVAERGNGNMVALTAESSEQVDQLYAKALELGASDEGAPGLRLPTFYGAYVRDPDGNKLAFFKMS